MHRHFRSRKYTTRIYYSFADEGILSVPFLILTLLYFYPTLNNGQLVCLNGYDAILLLNGIPLVQIELKTLEISPRRAMQQIIDYKKDPGNGYVGTLLCFMQLFIVSNRTNTCYFANNRNEHFSFNADEKFLPVYQWADEENTKITHLDEFTKVFLAKCALGEMISRYMVLVECEQKILIMRPYQIYAVKAIVDCIHQNRGNGYIWHTTGSGKTLTSFKASTLLKNNPILKNACLWWIEPKGFLFHSFVVSLYGNIKNEVKRFEIIFLSEARAFLLKIDEKSRDKIIFNIDKSKIRTDKNLFKKLEGEIWEFRTLYNKTYYRIFAFWDKEDKRNTMVLTTHGIIKKTDKTPKKEIQKAERLRLRYFELKNRRQHDEGK